MTHTVKISRDDLERDKLFDAGNLVEAIGLVIEDDDDLYFVIQSLARIAVEKINEVTTGTVIDALPTAEENADATEFFAAQRATPEGSTSQ